MEKVFKKAIATYGSEEIPDYIRIKKNLSNLTETPWECIRFPLPKTVGEAEELQERFKKWLKEYDNGVNINTLHEVFTNSIIKNDKIISFGNDDFGEDRLNPDEFEESDFDATYKMISFQGKYYLLHYYVVDVFAGIAVLDCIWYKEASSFLREVLDSYINNYKDITM